MGSQHYQIRKKKSGVKKGLAGGILLLSSVAAMAAIAAPSFAGRLGEVLHGLLRSFAGSAAFLIPFYLGWIGVQQFWRQKTSQIRDSALFFALIVSFACLLSLFYVSLDKPFAGLGGWLGDRSALFLVRQFGVFLVFVISAGAAVASGLLLARVHPVAVLALVRDKVEQDLEHWRQERKKLQEKNALKRKLEKSLPAISGTEPKASPAKPEIKESKPAAPAPDQDGSKPDQGPSLTSIVESKIRSLQRQGPVPETSRPASGSRNGNQEAASALKPSEPQPAAAPSVPTQEEIYASYRLPDPDLLNLPDPDAPAVNKEELYANGTLLEQTLEQFGVKAKVIDIHPGPVITRYDLTPAPGVRVQAIETLADDIALAMKAQSLRVLAPVPGKAAVGIEISNSHPATVYLKEIVLSPLFQKGSRGIPIGLGKSTEGESFVSDLCAMPHLLIAGATGSGKSVCIHAFILSILFRFRPDEVKLLLIDPKRLELPIYDGIPHLYDPSSPAEDVKVVTQPKDVVQTLKKLIEVMEERYKNFAKFGVRNIEGYNEKARAQKIPRVPYLIVIIDELADLMVVVGREIEDSIQRLAQMARAVGIHLVLATQRPSVDVITGVIKANLPSRAAFQVLSKTDSRVILDCQGAEDLLGRGDMLFLATGAPRPVRLQGAFVSEAEVNRVVQFIKEQGLKPAYESQASQQSEESIVDNEENRAILIRAARLVRDVEKVSGDLLRADKEIGSKYDLALTLLKKKGLIEKPKDTNRWKIHFDRLEAFLEEAQKKQEN